MSKLNVFVPSFVEKSRMLLELASITEAYTNFPPSYFTLLESTNVRLRTVYAPGFPEIIIESLSALNLSSDHVQHPKRPLTRGGLTATYPFLINSVSV